LKEIKQPIAKEQKEQRNSAKQERGNAMGKQVYPLALTDAKRKR
jgi:hypothetical protein